MHIPTEIPCQACQYVTSHPVDACPVCGTQFYWMVIAKESAARPPTEAFIAKMESLVEGNITREFLTHGGHIWLPHAFWDFSPHGDAIHEFSWIAEIRCLQHGSMEKPKKWSNRTEATQDQESSPWDTQPSLPSQIPRRVGADPASRRFMVDGAARTDHKEAETAARASGGPAHPRPSERKENQRGFFPRELFAPLMILIFFFLLSLSFLVLRYQKNQQAASRLPSKDVTYERSVLP